MSTPTDHVPEETFDKDDPLLQLCREAIKPPQLPAHLTNPAKFASRVRAAAAQRRTVYRRAAVVSAAAILLAVGLAAGYWLGARGRSGSDTVRPSEVVPHAPAREGMTCTFELIRPGPDGPVLQGFLGQIPVVARPGDTLVVRARASKPTLWVVVARAPDGTIIPLLPARDGEPAEPSEQIVIRHSIDQSGEWLVAVVATADEGGYRELTDTLSADAEFRRPLGTGDTLAYDRGMVTVVGEVRGAPTPPGTKAARERFEQLCRRLGERSGGEARAVVVPVVRVP